MGWLLLIAFASWIGYLGSVAGCAHVSINNAFSCGWNAPHPLDQRLISWAFVAAFLVYAGYRMRRRSRAHDRG